MITPKNILRQVELVIYKLKREYGLKLLIWHPLTSVHNITTGKIVRGYKLYHIRRAVMLPHNFQRDFVYDLAFIASGKNFTYGGFFDRSRRYILIAAKDIPTTFEITNDDKFIFEEKQWEPVSIELSEHKAAYLIIAKQLSAYDDVKATYEVTGGISHRINGQYIENGQHNSLLMYTKFEGTYNIWYDSTGHTWIISVTKGVRGSYYWIKGDVTITGDYSPTGTAAVGTATVTLI